MTLRSRRPMAHDRAYEPNRWTAADTRRAARGVRRAARTRSGLRRADAELQQLAPGGRRRGRQRHRARGPTCRELIAQAYKAFHRTRNAPGTCASGASKQAWGRSLGPDRPTP